MDIVSGSRGPVTRVSRGDANPSREDAVLTVLRLKSTRHSTGTCLSDAATATLCVRPSSTGLPARGRKAPIDASVRGPVSWAIEACHRSRPYVSGTCQCRDAYRRLPAGESHVSWIADSRVTRVVKDVKAHRPSWAWECSFSHKVLWFYKTGQCSKPRVDHISSEFPPGTSLAVKGDALIHGPSLVARPVGSEWRTRRPS